MKAEYVYGLHAVESLLNNQPETALEVWLQKSRKDNQTAAIQALADKQGVAVHAADRSRLDKLVDRAVHQGVVAKIRPAKVSGEDQFKVLIENLDGPAFLLFLDGIQDPHNLGACIRTAEAAGVQAIIFPKDRAASLTGVARKAAAGAAERVKLFQVSNLARCIEIAKKAGIWVVGAAGDVESDLYQIDLKGPLAIVMGAEGAGLKPRISGICDHLASIPMQGEAESLNVSVATGVVLFEAKRQRQIE